MGKRSREKQERKFLQQTEEKRNFNKSSLEKIYLFIIEWGTYLALFTPLILLRDYFFPFVSPKTIFFRIVVDIIFVAYVLLAVSNPRYRPRINILTASIIVFLGILVLTSFTGINLEKSFWSTFERMTGLLTFFHLFAFFIILTSVFRERKYWERILTVSIIIGVLLSFYVLINDDVSSRSGGTIGNVSFLAAYLLFDIFFALTFFLIKTGAWRIFYGAAFILMSSVLFFAAELPLGGISALFLGIFFLFLSYMVFSRKKLLKRLAPVVLVLVILAGILVSQTSFFKEKMFDIKDLPDESRKIVWQMAFEAWKEKPFLGWGPENFNIPFAKYFDPKLPLTGDIWYDRVHNIVLDTAVASGIIGLLSYLVIFGIAIFKLLRICPKVAEIKNVFLPLGMITVLAVYFIQNIWVFDMISTYMMFFLVLAFVSFLIESGKQETAPEKEIKASRIHFFLGFLLIIITIFTFYFGNIQPAKASKYIIRGITSPLENSIPIFQQVIEISPISMFEVPEQFSRKITGFTFDQNQNKEVLKNGFKVAAEEMEKSIAKYPDDFRLYLLLGQHYNDFYYVTQDPEKLNLAENFLEKAIELSPRNQQGYWSLAQTRISQGREEEVVELMQKSVDLDPRYPQSHWYLAMTYKTLESYELALEKVKDAEAVGFNWRGSLGELSRVIEIYQQLQDDENLILLYLLALEKNPQSAQFWAGLAVAYANLGQFDKAREAAQRAADLNPDFLPQLEEFLNSLPQ